MIKKIFLFCLLGLVRDIGYTQTTRHEMFETIEKTGGVYYAYPNDLVKKTAIPDGYEPFYISHYGRHGSRYLISDKDYKWVVELFMEAKKKQALTPLGLDTYNKLKLVWEEAEGRGGDLSFLGVQQERGIAERMFLSYPQVFKDSIHISARSTIVLRCVLSMDAFSERLKELNPHLQICRDASSRYMGYLNYHSEASNTFTSSEASWRKRHKAFEKRYTRPERLIRSLFLDSSYVSSKVNPSELMWGLYWIASDMQNMQTKVSFYNLFQKEELFDLWQCVNSSSYFCDANSLQGKGIVVENAKPLLRNIMEEAEKAVNARQPSATLRFGHDGNIIPLVALMHFNGCDAKTDSLAEIFEVWSNFKIVPMAGNVQIIFFRNKWTKNVIVKFLLNEKEIAIPIKSDIFPYYDWIHVKEYYSSIIK